MLGKEYSGIAKTWVCWQQCFSCKFETTPYSLLSVGGTIDNITDLVLFPGGCSCLRELECCCPTSEKHTSSLLERFCLGNYTGKGKGKVKEKGKGKGLHDFRYLSKNQYKNCILPLPHNKVCIHSNLNGKKNHRKLSNNFVKVILNIPCWILMQ